MITIFFFEKRLQNPIIFSELFKLEQKFTTNTIQTVSIVKEASFLAAKSEHFCEKAVISNKLISKSTQYKNEIEPIKTDNNSRLKIRKNLIMIKMIYNNRQKNSVSKINAKQFVEDISD